MGPQTDSAHHHTSDTPPLQVVAFFQLHRPEERTDVFEIIIIKPQWQGDMPDR